MARGRRIRTTRRRRLMTATVLVVAVGLVGYGVSGFLERREATHRAGVVVDPEVVTTTDDPEETPPDPACLSDLDASEARRISLPSLDVEGCMQKVGIDPEGRVGAPNNLHVAGWFVDSAPIGSGGLSVVVGHQTGKYVGGIFDTLESVSTGSVVSFEMGDGTQRDYRIVSVESIPVLDTMTTMYQDAVAEGATLAIITCDGPFSQALHQRADRLVVLAVDA